MNTTHQMKMKIANYKKANPGKSIFVNEETENKPGNSQQKKEVTKLLTPEMKKTFKEAGMIDDSFSAGGELTKRAIEIALRKRNRF